MAAGCGYERAFYFAADYCWVAFNESEAAVFILETHNLQSGVGFDVFACLYVIVAVQFDVKCAGVGFEA